MKYFSAMCGTELEEQLDKFSVKRKSINCNDRKTFEITYIGQPLLDDADYSEMTGNPCSPALSQIVSIINESTFEDNCIDYVLIDGLNDSERMFRCFAEAVEPIADRVWVRVSTIHKANAASKNQSLAKTHFAEILSEYGIASKSVVYA